MINIKKYTPKILKHYFRLYISKILDIPYNRYSVPNEIIEWLPIKDAITIIDIGASEGNFFLRLEQTYTIKKGVLIEPLPNRVIELKEKYGTKYDIIDCAISNIEGESEFYISTEFDYVSSLLELEESELAQMGIAKPKKVKIKTNTLDNIIGNPDIGIIDLIKIDVQGVEHLVLKSGINTIENTKMVYIEVSYKQLYHGSSTFFDIYNIFIANNFRLVNVTQGYKSSDGELLQSDVLFVNNKFFQPS